MKDINYSIFELPFYDVDEGIELNLELHYVNTTVPANYPSRRDPFEQAEEWDIEIFDVELSGEYNERETNYFNKYKEELIALFQQEREKENIKEDIREGNIPDFDDDEPDFGYGGDYGIHSC